MFSLSHAQQIDIFLDFRSQVFHIQMPKGNFYMCLFYILCFTKDFKKPASPWLFRNVGPKVTGFILGFCFGFLVLFCFGTHVGAIYDYLVSFRFLETHFCLFPSPYCSWNPTKSLLLVSILLLHCGDVMPYCGDTMSCFIAVLPVLYYHTLSLSL